MNLVRGFSDPYSETGPGIRFIHPAILFLPVEILKWDSLRLRLSPLP
jgi:hypothetical protein